MRADYPLRRTANAEAGVPPSTLRVMLHREIESRLAPVHGDGVSKDCGVPVAPPRASPKSKYSSNEGQARNAGVQSSPLGIQAQMTSAGSSSRSVSAKACRRTPSGVARGQCNRPSSQEPSSVARTGTPRATNARARSPRPAPTSTTGSSSVAAMCAAKADTYSCVRN